jgi:hypothetical protein
MPSRRQMLQSAAALAAGALGFGAVARQAASAATPGSNSASPAKGTLHLLGRNWHTSSEDHEAGHISGSGTRHGVSGELLDLHGSPVGDFLGSSTAVHGAGSPRLETHVLRLHDGTILGTGAISHGTEEQSAFAVVGGTGRYSGAKGSYVVIQRPVEFGGDGTAEITVTFTK